MRSSADLARLESMLREPMHAFVSETRVRIALLINGSGQVLAQHGFTRGYELVNVAALAAAAHASSRLLAEIAGVARWKHLHQGGAERQLFLSPIETPTEEIILVAIFDAESSLGLVQLFADQLADSLRRMPEFRAVLAPGDVHRFEHDLEAGLQRAFPARTDWGS